MREHLLGSAAVFVLIDAALTFGMAQTASSAGVCGALSASASPPATYKHVIWIWMENKNYNTIVGNSQAPYLNNTVAADCGLATNYYAASHPSTPNYLAATSGNTNNVVKYCVPKGCPDSHPSFFGQLTAAGKTWKAYEESMPSNCYKIAYPRTTSATYVPRHNPATYYADAAARCPTDDIPMGGSTTGSLATDLAANHLPSFSFVTPNLIDDMHTGSTQVATGDTWLSKWLPLIIASPSYVAGNTAVFITWDEGNGPKSTTTNYLGQDCTTNPGDISCHVPTFVATPYTSPDSRSATHFNQYSLLRTTEGMLGLPLLGMAQTANSMRADFGM